MAGAPRAKTLLGELERAGVSHVVGIPDNAAARLFRQLAESSTIVALTATREGEAFAVASGIWLGGKTPFVIVQNTGLLESGDSLRGTAVRMGVPLVCLVTYRGHAKLGREDGRDAMTRAEVDSAAVVTEPTLRAWRIPYQFYQSDADVSRLVSAFDQASAEARPVALLLTRHLV